MSLAILIAATCLAISALLLFAWPAYARGGFGSVADFWRFPGNRTLALILMVIIVFPFTLAYGPLAGSGMLVQLEPSVTTSA
jgi:hypothetical protein